MDRARILGTVLALIFVAVGIASATPTISWQPTSLTQTGFAGTQPFTVVQLTSQTAIANLSLRVVPQLAPFVSVSPSSVSSTGKGQPLRVQVMFKFPSTMALGTLQGTVQIITSNPGVLPLPLSVTISILQPTADFIPAFVSPASPDRLQLDPLSGTLFATNEVDAIFRPGVGLQRVESLIATLPGTFIGSDQTSQFFQISVSGSDGATLENFALGALIQENAPRRAWSGGDTGNYGLGKRPTR